MSRPDSTPDPAVERAALERERVELERERTELERQRLEHARAVAERKSEGRRVGAAWASAVVPVLAALVAFIAVTREIGASQDAADERARIDQRLAAVSVVLGAPTCASAEARARLALAVLGGEVVGDSFVEDVRGVRVGAFPEGIGRTYLANQQFVYPFTKTTTTTTTLRGKVVAQPRDEAALKAAQREYEAALAKARQDRELLCSELGG